MQKPSWWQIWSHFQDTPRCFIQYDYRINPDISVHMSVALYSSTMLILLSFAHSQLRRINEVLKRTKMLKVLFLSALTALVMRCHSYIMFTILGAHSHHGLSTKVWFDLPSCTPSIFRVQSHVNHLLTSAFLQYKQSRACDLTLSLCLLQLHVPVIHFAVVVSLTG